MPVPAMHTVEGVAGIELHSRLGGVDLQYPPGVRIISSRRQHQARALPVNHEVVIIPNAANNQLLILVIDPFPNCRGLGEIEWCSMYAGNFSSGDQRGIDRGEVVSVKCQFFPKDISASFASQV